MPDLLARRHASRDGGPAMSCVQYGSTIVCGLGGVYRRRILPCWGKCGGDYGNGRSRTPGPRRRVVVRHGSPWYGPDYCCCHCGDSWSRDGLYRRPVERAWRVRAAAEHKAAWAAARSGPVRYDANFYPIPDGYGDRPVSA